MANVSVLTVANGRLSNESISVCAPYYQSYYFGTTWSDYSGGTLNPYYGPFGALMAFGQGHSAGNNNQVPTLVLGEVCTWKSVNNPSPIFGTGTDVNTKAYNARGDFSYRPYAGGMPGFAGQVLVNQFTAALAADGQPPGMHSYNLVTVLEPTAGAPSGTLFTPMIAAGAYNGIIDTQSFTAYKMTLDAAAPSGAAIWQRLFTHPTYPAGQALAGYASAPAHVVYDQPTKRVILQDSSAYQPRWYALTATSAATAFVQGTGTALNRSDYASGSYSHMMIGVPERRLAIMLYKKNTGFLGARWMDVSAAQPSWINTGANITLNIPLDQDWSSACWCVDNGCIIIGDIKGSRSIIYEILLPAVLTDPWVATSVSLSTPVLSWEDPSNRTYDNANVYGKFAYSPALKCIPFFHITRNLRLPDVMYAIRPRGV